MTDSFSVPVLQAALGSRPFRYVGTTTSTQDLARHWAQESPAPPAGAVVVADHQTAGRGRQGRVWRSQPGSSLLCSVILHPAPDQLPGVTMIGGLAVCDALAPLLGERARLKWPNDVLIDGRKVCGILAEATWIGDTLAAVILGIGINVRGSFAGTDLAGIATSVEAEAGVPVNRRALLAALMFYLDHWLAQAADPILVTAWRSRLGTLGKRVNVYTEPDKTHSPYFTGIAEAVDEGGALLVRLESGEVRRVVAGDVGLSEQ